jgi:Cdc6-like AAA superfamily ATPase
MDNIAVIKNHTTAQQDGAAAQHNRALLEWICPTDYHAQHADYVRRRQIGTGEWFLQDSRFQDWMRSEESTLFCPGMPGAGKTMMATLVIDRLLRSENRAERPIAFIYCNYKQQSKQSIEHMLSSLLRQVVDIQEEIPQILQDVYATCVAKRSRPSEWEFEQILSAVTKGLLGLTVVVDALDECEAHICEGLLSIVGDLRKQCKVRLLATSRNLPEIRSYTTFLGKPILEVRASDQDLEKYIRSRVGEFRSRRRIASNPDLLETLVFGIVSASGGM